MRRAAGRAASVPNALQTAPALAWRRSGQEAGTRLVLVWARTALRGAPTQTRRYTVLYYAIVFFVIALLAAVFGFGGIAGAATGIAKILFFVFLVLFVISLLVGRRPRV